ncbi:hypothetical protein SAP269_02990 [Spiroplasma ixodetis]|uniref:Uncharacterized protein n=1 Tax=Spiroplasma ixodetis TaxID=2141 RepID=A0ABM8JKF1_9MOLU
MKKNKKEILNALGIIDINNTNEFKIFNTPFALEILLKYTNNNDKLKQIYEHSLISWKKSNKKKT